MKDNDSFEHIVAGSGAAGCALADRLGTKLDTSMLLLEEGAPDADTDRA